MADKIVTPEEVKDMVKNDMAPQMAAIQDDIKIIKADIEKVKGSCTPEDIAKVMKAEAASKLERKMDELSKDEKEHFLATLIAPVADKQVVKSSDSKRALEMLRKDDYENATTAAYGGNLITTIVAPMIADQVMAESEILPDCDIMPIPAGVKIVNLPTSLGGATVYWQTTEGDAITASAATLGKVTLTPEQYGVIVPLTGELLTFANPNAASWVIREISKSLAREFDKQLMAGTSLIATGIRDSATLNTQTLAASTFAITEAEAVVTASYLSDDAGINPTFYVTQSVWQKFFAGLKEATGGNYLIREQWNQPNKIFAGYPVKFVHNTGALPGAASSGAAATCAVLADLKAAAKVGTVGVTSIATSTEASVYAGSTTYNLFQRNMLAVRATGFMAAGLPDFTGATPATYTGVKIVSHA